MRNLAIIFIYLSFVLCFSNCGNGEYNHTLSASDTLPADTLPIPVHDESIINKSEIIIPLTFDPKTPLTDKLRNADLQEMLIEKYYSFKNPKNRRKHRKVLYLRTNRSGVIDLTEGGPLNYEEMWELKEEQGHSLREYFYDAAYIDRHTGIYNAVTVKESDYKYVPVTSNLAKVFFIDDFEGFVNLNKDYCDGIINGLESQARAADVNRIKNNQAKYE